MNGEDLLKAMGQVDERFIHEADTAGLKKPVVLWTRRLGTAAACLAVLLSVATVIQMSQDSKWLADSAPEAGTWLPAGDIQMENAPGTFPCEATVAPALNDCVPETVPAQAENNTQHPIQEPEQPADSAPIRETAGIVLQIDAWLEDGFEATVKEILDDEGLSKGTVIRVVFSEGMRITRYEGETIRVSVEKPSEEEFPVGSLVRVEYSMLSTDVLLVDGIEMEDAL